MTMNYLSSSNPKSTAETMELTDNKAKFGCKFADEFGGFVVKLLCLTEDSDGFHFTLFHPYVEVIGFNTYCTVSKASINLQDDAEASGSSTASLHQSLPLEFSLFSTFS